MIELRALKIILEIKSLLERPQENKHTKNILRETEVEKIKILKIKTLKEIETTQEN